ncbi:hypothetical protein [Leisingera sp. M523]|uniref:hypothetical protein n=1 Tax=Leisingera sp. M523 TaxID=2867013 RepID=UPI0021A4D318|nr:hypothetical protein [Leisingera sp. M523]UWQ28860.1 hypothetical protein K3557_19350 [Leisingera sp. M523]
MIDVEPELKMALYATLASEGMSMKHWFSQVATEFLAEQREPRLALEDDTETTLIGRATVPSTRTQGS